MAQPFTSEIKIAMLKLKLIHGSNEAIANKLGISKVHVGHMLAGKIETIQTRTWEKMEPALRPYLKEARSAEPEPNAPGLTIAIKDLSDEAQKFLFEKSISENKTPSQILNEVIHQARAKNRP